MEEKCQKCDGKLIRHFGGCKCDLDFCHGQRCGELEKRGKSYCPTCNPDF